MTERQQILDWRLAKGIVFTQAEIAELANVKPSRVGRMRTRLDYTDTYAKRHTTLGQAIVILTLLRAEQVPHKRHLDTMGAIARYIDEPNTPMPVLVAFTLDSPPEYWVANEWLTMLDNIGRLDRCIDIMHVPTLTEHLCNGHAQAYRACNADQG